MTGPTSSGAERRSTQDAGAGLIRVGVIVTVAGMVLALVAMLPLVTSLVLPSGFWGLSMLTGVGFAMILLGLARSGSERARTQVAALAEVAPSPVGHPGTAD